MLPVQLRLIWSLFQLPCPPPLGGSLGLAVPFEVGMGGVVCLLCLGGGIRVFRRPSLVFFYAASAARIFSCYLRTPALYLFYAASFLRLLLVSDAFV
jgi:hypothetical protein